MDSTLAETLKANLKSAKTPEEISHAKTLAIIALVDCQYKTSDRVKKLVAQDEIRRQEAETIAHERKRVVTVASIVMKLLWGFAAGGGFVVLAKVVKALGVL